MTAGSEEPEFVPPAGSSAREQSAADDLLRDEFLGSPAAADPAGALDPPGPPAYPWHWLAWGAIALGAMLFARSWWRTEQHSIAVARTNAAIERIEAGQSAEAITLLTEAVEHDPTLAIAWANRAAARIRLSQFDEARRDCEMALKYEPDNYVALTNLGAVLQEAGDLTAAREALTRSIASNRAAGQAWLSRASIALSLGDNEAAASDATEALRLFSERRRRARALEVRGSAYLASRDFTSALGDFSEASKIEPDRPEYQSQISDCYEAQGDLAQAEAHATHALDLAPERAGCHERRASLRLRLKNFAGVIDDCNRALEINPRSALAFTFRAAARTELNQPAEAIADCGAALEIDPNLVSALLVRGDAWRRHGEPTKAVDDYSEVLRQNPGHMMAWFGRGVARSQMRDYAAAIADYSKAIELNPDFAPAWYNRAISHEALGKGKEAKSDREKALELDPHIGSIGRTEST